MLSLDILIKNPELAKNLRLEITGTDVLNLAEEMAKQAIEKAKVKSTPEEYMTCQQLADALHVSLVTVWSWDKKNILHPLRIGNRKLYRRSDLEKILKEG